MYIFMQIIKWSIIILSALYILFIFLTRPVADLKNTSLDIKYQKAFKGMSPLAGIDVSYYQGQVEWNKVLTDNVHFVYLKATDGITYTDPMFHENQNTLMNEKALYGAYHFFEPKDSGVKQAENFLAQVKIHKNMLAPVLDIEITQGVDKELLKKHVREWLETVSKKFDCKPIIYSYSSFYEQNLGTDFVDYPVWIADYTKKPDPLKGEPQFIMWQHSDHGDIVGINSMVDKNWFFGNYKNLESIKCKKESEKEDDDE